MSLLADKLTTAFKKDKDYRHGYVDEFLNAFIATQIKVLREQRNWTQHQLAEEAGMKQQRICVMENVNYSSWSINTLRRLAEAFDLTLNVSFEDFGKRLADMDRFSRESLERFSFAEDPAFAEQPIEEGQPSHLLTEALKEFQHLQRRELPKVIDLMASCSLTRQRAQTHGTIQGKPSGESSALREIALWETVNQ